MKRAIYFAWKRALTFDEVKIEQLRRAGFVHEGTLRQHIRWGGDYVGVEMFGLLQRDWIGYEDAVAALELQQTPDIEPKSKPAEHDDQAQK